MTQIMQQIYDVESKITQKEIIEYKWSWILDDYDSIFKEVSKSTMMNINIQ